MLSQVASVNLQIVPRDSAAPVVNQNMTPGSGSLGPFETTNVTGLSAGRYRANWKLTDLHGDSNAFQVPFAVQPGGGGPEGAHGPAGRPVPRLRRVRPVRLAPPVPRV